MAFARENWESLSHCCLPKSLTLLGPNGDAIQLLLWVCPKFGSFDFERVKKLEMLDFELEGVPTN
jgi:hypothetical protein